jgi:uncharacterized protein YbjT (DUF2867 family)
MKTEKILVLGSSGTVGSEVVRLLKAEGYSVRGTTSKKTNDPNMAKVDLVTGEGIQAAFEGIDKTFLLSPSGYADEYRTLSPLIQEAKRRGLKKVVLMTAMGANADEAAPFRRAEIELEKSGLAYNIVRPNWFLQNFNTFWLKGIKEQNKILLPAGNAKVSFIDAKDISAAVVKLLTSDKFNNQAFDITGPQALDHDQVAKEISAVSERKVVYQENQPAELKKELLGAGLPEDYIDFLLIIMGYLKQGYNQGITKNVRLILGREPRTIKQYAQENRGAWA